MNTTLNTQQQPNKHNAIRGIVMTIRDAKLEVSQCRLIALYQCKLAGVDLKDPDELLTYLLTKNVLRAWAWVLSADGTSEDLVTLANDYESLSKWIATHKHHEVSSIRLSVDPRCLDSVCSTVIDTPTPTKVHSDTASY